VGVERPSATRRRPSRCRAPPPRPPPFRAILASSLESPLRERSRGSSFSLHAGALVDRFDRPKGDVHDGHRAGAVVPRSSSPVSGVPALGFADAAASNLNVASRSVFADVALFGNAAQAIIPFARRDRPNSKRAETVFPTGLGDRGTPVSSGRGRQLCSSPPPWVCRSSRRTARPFLASAVLLMTIRGPIPSPVAAAPRSRMVVPKMRHENRRGPQVALRPPALLAHGWPSVWA